MFVTRPFVITGLFVALAPALASAEQGARHQPRVPPVPVAIEAPAGHSAYLKGYAVGTQNYICVVTKAGTLDWTFIGPQATLFLTSHGRPVRQIMTHVLSPNPDEAGTLRASWQDSDDSSAVWALSIRSSQDPAYVDADAIPWLLLEVVGDRRGPAGGRALVRTTFIQRLNTSGGRKPATGCAVTDDIGAAKFVPYTADYYFYRED
jgi:hypothetical protein